MSTTSGTKRNLLHAGQIMIALPAAACNMVEDAGKDTKAVGDAGAEPGRAMD